jgi:hypothetical protein
MKKFIVLLVLLLPLAVLGQSTVNYSYSDPCTGKVKDLTFQDNQTITVNYLGYIQAFDFNQINNGELETWINGVARQNTSSPCAAATTVVTTAANLAVTTNIISTLTNVTSVATSVGSSLASAIPMPSTPSSPSSTPSSSTPSSKKSEGGEINDNATEEPTPTITTTEGGSDNTGGSVSNSVEGTSSEGGNSGGGGGKSTAKAKEAKTNTGSLIGSGDIVVTNNRNDNTNNLRMTASMTKSNYKNTFAKGFLLNFTTQINNSNLTFYTASTKKKSTLIFANSSLVNKDYDIFNTTTAIESYRFGKFSAMGGVNFTLGKIGTKGFQNLSSVAGGFYLFPVNKNITGNFLLLSVYSPFTQFYDGRWWNSGLLLVPFSSWDFKITKTFKFNVSFSGVYELNKSMLNYQILTGGKIML